ncbi:hypothetical protein DBB34_04475 [Sphaerisporangium cinnabarinum]|nr:cell wall-binding repeat-containing protein [Sphaerisporangium cinnabarinum]PTU57315.1 hypothetical protein DBB34_04475 [Sphaerisporangium cinnabarinum]
MARHAARTIMSTTARTGRTRPGDRGARRLRYAAAPFLVLSLALAPAASATPGPADPESPDAAAQVPAVTADLPEVGTAAASVVTHDVTPGGAITVEDGFQTAALTWPSRLDGAVPELRLRAFQEDGAWGPWTHAERSTDGADTGTGDVVATTTVYVGESEAVEVSTVDPGADLPDGVRVTTVSSEPVGAAGAGGAGAVPAEDRAQAAAGPVIVTRAQWGAAPARCAWDAAPALKGGVVHHTVNTNDYTSTAQVMQLIRNDQAFHQAAAPNGNGWCDLGYNFLVDKWGNVYEGAAGSLETALIGAHTGGFNTGTVGVAMVGTYTSTAPPEAQLDGVAKIIAYRLARYGVDPAGTATFTAASRTAGGRFAAGQSVVLPKVFGHRDTHQTECPGGLAYGRLAHVQDLAARYFQQYVVRAERISGANRYATSAAISAATFSPGVPVAYVANGQAFPDALSGGAAAVVGGAPVLLVASTAVPTPVLQELERLRPGRIVVLGGTGVVPGAVVAQLEGLTQGGVTRLSGADRFATSAAISAATFAPGPDVAYVANGLAFPDALSAAPVAGAERAPVLLVGPTSVPASVEGELLRLRPGRIVVLGGAGSVSAAVADQLATLAPGGVTRTAGADRYATSAAVSARAFSPGVPVVFVANGLDFPDSLSGAPAAGIGGGPVLLTASTRIPASVAAELDRLDPARVVVLGGAGAVSEPVREALSAYVRGSAS